MVKVITLEPGDLPPAGVAHIVMEWSIGEVTSFRSRGRSLHYVIGRPKHRFWSTEAIILAVRMGFDEIYYIGRPSEVASPIDVRKYASTRPLMRNKWSRPKSRKQTPRGSDETSALL